MLGRWSRYAPLTGVAFVALIVAGVATSNNTPNSDASGQKVLAFYQAHHSSQQTGDFLFALAVVFLVFFTGSLRGYLRRTPAAEALSAVVLAGAVLLGTGLLIFSGLDFALSDVPSKLDPAAAQALNLLDNDLFFPVAAGGCIYGIAAGLAILRGAALPDWLGWVAIVIGIAAATPAAFPALIAFAVWTVVVGILVYMRTGADATAPLSDPAGA
ncbi:MAG TPA: hypothetical protein VGY97_11685 [Solirubrobacteraceae bacterium]|jgi:hypothetical protein|nr:hypothetical protein [Solirubrobacteraceae bacterium]